MFRHIISIFGLIVVVVFGAHLFLQSGADVLAQLRSPIIFLTGNPGPNTGNTRPVASIDSAAPTTGETPLIVAFEGSGSDADGDLLTYHWDFGDGGTSGDQNPTHQFSAGNYVVEFWVNDGQIDSLIRTQVISVTNPAGGGLTNVGDMKVEAYADFANNRQDIIVSWVGDPSSDYYTIYDMTNGQEVLEGQVTMAGSSTDMIFNANDMNLADTDSYYEWAVRPFSGGSGTSCTDGVQNGNETDIDCGGSCIANCSNGEACLSNLDCVSNFCDNNVCAQGSTCNDLTQNGSETDVDCGGSCNACQNGEACSINGDCVSGLCDNNVCTSPTVIIPPALPFM